MLKMKRKAAALVEEIEAAVSGDRFGVRAAQDTVAQKAVELEAARGDVRLAGVTFRQARERERAMHGKTSEEAIEARQALAKAQRDEQAAVQRVADLEAEQLEAMQTARRARERAHGQYAELALPAMRAAVAELAPVFAAAVAANQQVLRLQDVLNQAFGGQILERQTVAPDGQVSVLTPERLAAWREWVAKSNLES